MKVLLYEFADKINLLMAEITRSFVKHQTDELFKGKITIPQVLILSFLNKENESKMSDIAHFLNVSTAASTGVVDRLVKYRYVQRVFEPADRRIVKIKLTLKGLRLIKNINKRKRQMIVDIFGKISQKERDDYLRILTRIHDVLT